MFNKAKNTSIYDFSSLERTKVNETNKHVMKPKPNKGRQALYYSTKERNGKF